MVEQLLEHGAQMTRNEQGMTPLLCAAERTKADVVEFLLRRRTTLGAPLVGREDAVEALELLGASFANDKDSYSLELAFSYLHRAMTVSHVFLHFSVSM